ncbi:hypothetical protein CCZ15_11290 [Escherichia coli]|nr:hypothetical protein [Escherichia coli]RBL18917.1 hypothetical protein CCZ10_11470 [Escherichia coli]RBL55538.1 hypothetical protein CCZ15_11290 [Escherichia coli]
MYCVVCLQALSCRSYAILTTTVTFNVKYVNKTLHYCPETGQQRSYAPCQRAKRSSGRVIANWSRTRLTV